MTRDGHVFVIDGDVSKLACDAWLLLDYVGSRAVSDVQFVADDSLGQLRSDEETDLAAVISDLKRFLDLFPRSAH